ncbi:hypothetical protein E9529_16835 [Blastococcus sp. KM273128]|uniref:hypothetical protein n=1 Tax=Blastococcus sp. KM273128 TaxID=2570314 RepID=UPI001F3A3B6F|nr:hypothetical protein [Blastococcus sp. KM273128]MCF6745913.1 hypothetical protein [Blastococcus sp. KM273128]
MSRHLAEEDNVVGSSGAAMALALSLLLEEFLRFFGWCALGSFALGVCGVACSAMGARRRSVEVDHGAPVKDDAELRRQAARGIAELELWLVAQPPQAQDPGDPG